MLRMLENRVIRYLTYGTSAVIISEVIYHSYRYVRGLLAGREDNVEVAEVIWTNELTQTCAGAHTSFSKTSPDQLLIAQKSTKRHAGAVVGQAQIMTENGRIVKLPSPTATPICRNRYCAANNVGRLIALIDKSEYTIDLAMYTFTSYELCQAFMRALRRGVVIRVISDKEMVYSSGSQIINLTKAGVPVRCPTTTLLMHHKFCILDGPMRAGSILLNTGKKYNTKQVTGVLMSGSLNWTMQGFGGNWENILITSNKTLVQEFENEYTRMWKTFNIQVKSS